MADVSQLKRKVDILDFDNNKSFIVKCIVNLNGA